MMYKGSFERQRRIVDEIKKSEACLQKDVTDSMDHRVMKMIEYGWYVEFVIMKTYDTQNEMYISQRLYVTCRTSNSLMCSICGLERQDPNIYSRVPRGIVYVCIGNALQLGLFCSAINQLL